MSDKFSFELITPAGLKFQADVYEVLLPTPQGQIGILPDHRPLINIVSPGVISIRHNRQHTDDQLEHMATAGGFAQIDGRRLRLLADLAERAEDIDEFKAKAALERARELQHAAKDQVSLADATALIEQNTARLKVAELKKRKKTSRL
ncbi:MAG: ATP synthase F1 subunit epsilon [Candidatus Andersenbacteria bacterium]|nr:ATP synthase F1 subunit epsilon [bacterium]MDZ4225437.1 ATP synthase F1 subunit epsilon [Candidatus Andersenbacteria bacterium]